jgi:uncharacterized protein YkwD
MKNINTQFTFSLFTIFAFAACFSHASVASASEITPDKVVGLANQDRISHGFQPFQVNDALVRAAQGKANDMAENAYFAHTSPKGVTPWYWIAQSGYDYHFAGENLAIHFTDAEEQEKAWMASIKHRENILSPKYQDIGVSVRHTVQNGREAIIVVQMFGLPSGVALSIANSKTNTSSQESVNNGLVSSIGSAHKESVRVTNIQNQSTSHLEVTKPWMKWFGVSIALISVIIGLPVIVMKRKILFYRYFHKDDIFQYRA